MYWPRGGGGAVSHFAISSVKYPWITLHEFGHSFGGLADTYGYPLPSDGIPILANNFDSPNVDIGGCPKWCKSKKDVYQTACTKITVEEECRHYEREYSQSDDKWVCSDRYKCCVWLPEADPFFATKCVNARGNVNIGIDCYGDSGCYYGTYGQISWRSSLKSGIMTQGFGEAVLKFEDVNQRELEKILGKYSSN